MRATSNLIFHQESPHVVILFAQEYMLSYVQTASKLDFFPISAPGRQSTLLIWRDTIKFVCQTTTKLSVCDYNVATATTQSCRWCILEETSGTIDCICCPLFTLTKLLKFSLILFDLNEMQQSSILASSLSTFRADSANYPLASCLLSNMFLQSLNMFCFFVFFKHLSSSTWTQIKMYGHD